MRRSMIHHAPLAWGLSAVLLVLTVSQARAEDGGKHLLRYKFQQGETISWRVGQFAKFRTAVGGISREDESSTRSTKVWTVVATHPDGSATIQHQVDDIDMMEKIDGAKQHYNSKTDKGEDVPVKYRPVAETVGKPLFEIKISPTGEELERKNLRNYTMASKDDQITLSLPEEAIEVGHSWTQPFEVQVPVNANAMKKIRMQKKFTLTDVTAGIAAISLQTQILTPMDSPEIKSQLMQRLRNGVVKFDIDTGRVREQQFDINEVVVGASGERSSIELRERFTESLVTGTPVAESASSAGNSYDVPLR